MASYRSVKRPQIKLPSITTVLILGAVVIFFKPILKLFKTTNDTLAGGADTIGGFLTNLGLIDSEEVKAYKAAVANTGSFWYRNFWIKNWTKGRPLITREASVIIEGKIKSFFGFWDDDEEGLYKYLNSTFQTQSQFSLFCDYFIQRNGENLHSALTSGLVLTGLSQKEMAKVHQIILSKPKS